jgi:hypothetical protein
VHLWVETVVILIKTVVILIKTVVILIKIESFRQIFEKHSKIKFHENPSSGKPIFNADGQTDRHEEAKISGNSHFSQFCKYA